VWLLSQSFLVIIVIHHLESASYIEGRVVVIICGGSITLSLSVGIRWGLFLQITNKDKLDKFPQVSVTCALIVFTRISRVFSLTLRSEIQI
jgi:hypothetical protein